jgi:hypothetical protein
MRLIINSWLISGLPRQFWLMKENKRCSILFHLLVPGGKWQTAISRPAQQPLGFRVARASHQPPPDFVTEIEIVRHLVRAAAFNVTELPGLNIYTARAAG